MAIKLPHPPLCVVAAVLSFERKELFEKIHDSFPRVCEDPLADKSDINIQAERYWREANCDGFTRLRWLEEKLAQVKGRGRVEEISADDWCAACEAFTQSMDYADFLTSWYWRFIRATIIPQRSTLCERCQEDGRRNLQLHHTDYAFRGLERLHPEIIEVLCDVCHREEHGLRF